MTAVAERTLKSACAAVISPLGKVLLTQRNDNGKWELPGGTPEVGETDASVVAHRELLEETGIDARLWREIVIEVPSIKFPGSYYGVVVYFASSQAGRLKLDLSEVRDAAWRDLEDVEGMIPFQVMAFMPLVRQIVDEVLGPDLR